MSKSEIRRIQISVRAEIEAELREQIAQEILNLPRLVRYVDDSESIDLTRVLNSIRGK